MSRIIRNCVLGLLVIFVLFLILIAVVAMRFNPNDYKPQVIELVQQKKHRTLTIPGEIKLRFFPKIGADLGAVTLSERDSSAQFASVQSASVSLAFWPLLKKQVIVDRVMIDGVHIELKRDKQGKMNIDDLMEKQEASDSKVQLDIDSIHIGNADFIFDDQQGQRRIELSKVNMESGRIASGVPSKLDLQAQLKMNQPALDLALALKGGFTIDFDKQDVKLKDVSLTLNGKAQKLSEIDLKLAGNLSSSSGNLQVEGFSIAGKAKNGAQQLELKGTLPHLELMAQQAKAEKMSWQAKLQEGKRNLVLDMAMPAFSGSAAGVDLPKVEIQLGLQDANLNARAVLDANWHANFDKMRIEGRQLTLTLDGKQGDLALSGQLAAQLVADLKAQRFDLQGMNSNWTLPNPKGGGLKLSLDGNAAFDGVKQSLSSMLKGKIDESQFDARLGVQMAATPAYELNLNVDKIDLDRYQAAPATPKSAPPNADPALDLSGLKGLRAKAHIQFGQVKVAEIQLAQVKFDVLAANDKLELNGISASLYQGKLQGALSVTASASPHLHVQQSLSGVALGPLLKDVIKKEPVSGHANVELNLDTQGARVSQLKQALSGSAKMSVTDGAVSGVNLAQIIRNAKAKVGGAGDAGAGPGTGAGTGTSSANDKTDFSDLSASFTLKDGVAHNQDLSAKSPLFRVVGNGDIDIGKDRLDYLVKPTVVATLQGQGGPELQALKGLTIPVRLSGPFTNIAWKIDMQALVADAAKQKVEEKKEEIKTKATDKLKDALKGIFK